MNEQLTNRQLQQIAETAQEQLQAMRVLRYGIVLLRLEGLASELGRVESLKRRLGVSVERRWYAAAEKTTANIHRSLRDIPYALAEVQRASEVCEITPLSPELLAELRQLQEEFGQIHWDRERQALSITTEVIELEDVYLGDFQVVLDLSRLSQNRSRLAYRVVALDPHPAGCNGSVTHPHVSDEHLCEGDASAPIANALAQGRLCDFFMLVRSVLTTYNAYSPYVALADWSGRSCHDCGYHVSIEDSYHCQSCEHDFCDSCISFCRCCDDSLCMGCMDECPICGERTCSSCMTTCRECGRTLCKTCREDDQCPCHEETVDEGDEQDDEHDGGQEKAAAGHAGEME